MAERIFVQGNEAVGWGALAADCHAFFGYPITPQNETTEWFAREFPKRGRVFLQSASEVSSINMLYGAAATGVRAMTSTSSPGWGLMQEGMSCLANGELPCVVVLVQRGGPGQGTTRHSQMDYTSTTRGGGQGGYKTIVLAPSSVQETHDLLQLAFHLADKYLNPAILLSDSIIAQTRELLERKTLDFGPLPEKDWAVVGRKYHEDGEHRCAQCGSGFIPIKQHPTYLSFIRALNDKINAMQEAEVRYETQQTEDAELVLVAFGYVARVCREALRRARAQGLRVGLLRPVAVWPFPSQVVASLADKGARFLVVEDNLGQMVGDVKSAAEGKTKVHLVSALDRHEPGEGGAIYPEKVVEKINAILRKE